MSAARSALSRKTNARAFALATGWRDNGPGKYVNDAVGVIERSRSGWWWFYPVDGSAGYRAGTLVYAIYYANEHTQKKAARAELPDGER